MLISINIQCVSVEILVLQFTIENVNFYKYSMCLCGNLGLLKESGQYSTLTPEYLTWGPFGGPLSAEF